MSRLLFGENRVDSGKAHTRLRVRRWAALTALMVVGLLILLGLPALAAAAPSPDVYFVYLGDVWRSDGTSLTTSQFYTVDSESVGNVSWSTDGRTVAFEQQLGIGDFDSKVIIRESASVATGTFHWIPSASAPVPSPDGTDILYETWSLGGPTLGIYDVFTASTTTSLFGAYAGTWSADERFLAYNRNPNSFPTNDGFYIYDRVSGIESKRAVVLPGEGASDSNAWAPRWSPSGSKIAVTKYVNSTQRIKIVTVSPSGGGATEVVDVTDYDWFDYRWRYDIGGGETLLVETVPPLGGRPTISVPNPLPGGGLIWQPLFRDSSFGFNASLPAEHPFNDLDPSHPYYHAITSMLSYFIVSGYQIPAGGYEFRPNNPVLRAQFAKMIVGALGLAVDESMTSPFTDLGTDSPGNLYPHEFVASAYNNGLTKGKTATTFSPYTSITRAQMMTMVVRAAQQYLGPGGLDPVPAGFIGYMGGFNDPTHGANAHLAEWNNLLAGINLIGWNVWAPATRGEVAQMLWNLMKERAPEIVMYAVPFP